MATSEDVSMEKKINILGTGFYTPGKVLRNSDLEKIVDTSDEWILTRTGIKERRLAEKGQGAAELALYATYHALENAGMQPSDITNILFATFTPNYCQPSSACVLQDKIGASNCKMAMDLAAGCSGFIYALETARGIAQIQPEANILVLGSEVCTARLNFEDRDTCVLFGDGAGAALVSASQVPEYPWVVDTNLRSDGGLGHLLPVGKEGGSVAPYKQGEVVSSDYFIQMNGRELFRHAVRGMAEMSLETLKRNDLSVIDIDLVIPHQANLRIIEALAKRFECSMDKIYVNVDSYGNTSAASVIIALSEACSLGYIEKGSKVLLTSFGAGLTWATAILQF